MRSDRSLAWLCGAAAALFYLSFHSYFYNFDGVACAVAVELSDFKHLVHGNHLAYGVVGWAFVSLWKLLGYRGAAMLPLQALNSLLGGAAVGVFYSALRRADIRRATALGCAAALALSQGLWLWSLEAQVYPLGVLAAALALRELLAREPRASRLGALQGLAVLGHVGHAMLAPAALFALRRRGKGPLTEAVARYLAAGAAVVVPAYALAGALAVRPGSWAQARVWLLGSAALNHQKAFAWHGGLSLVGLRAFAAMSLRVVSDYLWAPAGAPRALCAALALIVLALAAAGAARARKPQASYEPTLALLWLASYAALFLTWEPHTMVYRLSDLLPLWLLAALALSRAPWAAAALAATLGAANFAWGIAPVTDPAHNPDYQEAVWLRDALPPEAVVVVTGQGQVYEPYFAHLRPLNLYYWEERLPELSAELDARRARGETLFVTSRTLTLQGGGAAEWFSAYGLSEVARRDGTALYQVAGMNGKPNGSTRNRLKTAPTLKNGPKGIGSERVARPRAINATP